MPIKAGVAIIYMGAVDRYKADPEIVACGINYDNGHKFRSTAIVEFGVPYKMPESMITQYKQPENKKTVISNFLDLLSKFFVILAQRLVDVKISADNQEELLLVYLARNLYLSDERSVDKATELDLIRSITDNFHSAANNNDMAALRRDLMDYKASLTKTGVKDWELKTLDTSTTYNILRLIYSFIYVAGACTIVRSVF